MKRIVLATALLIAAGAAADADGDRFTNLLKQPRGDDVLNVDAQTAELQWVADVAQLPALHAQPRLALRLQASAPTPRLDRPRRGLRCHSIMGGFGSMCSN